MSSTHILGKFLPAVNEGVGDGVGDDVGACVGHGVGGEGVGRVVGDGLGAAVGHNASTPTSRPPSAVGSPPVRQATGGTWFGELARFHASKAKGRRPTAALIVQWQCLRSTSRQ